MLQMFRLLYITQLYNFKERLVKIIIPEKNLTATLISAPLSARNIVRKFSSKFASMIKPKKEEQKEQIESPEQNSTLKLRDKSSKLKGAHKKSILEKNTFVAIQSSEETLKTEKEIDEENKGKIEEVPEEKISEVQIQIKDSKDENESKEPKTEEKVEEKKEDNVEIPTKQKVEINIPKIRSGTILIDTPTIERVESSFTPVPETPVLDNPVLPQNEQSKSFIEKNEKLNLKRFEILKLYVSSEFLLTIFFMAMIFQGILFATINTIYYYDLWVWSKGCVLQVPVFFLVLSSLILYSTILVIMSIRLYGVKEEFGIKMEMFWILLIWIFFMILFILMSTIPYWNRVLEYYFSAVWNIVLACFVSNIVGILIPTLKTFNCRKRKVKQAEGKVDHQTLLKYMAKDHKDDPSPMAHDFHTSSHMDSVLGHKVASTFLKQYCAREWSSENILFLEQIRDFKTLKEQEDKLKYANIIYNTFLSNNATLELNTNKKRKDEVNEIIKKANIDSTIEISSEIFKDIETDIHQLMLDTWTRFIDSDLFPKMREALLQSDFVKENLMDMIAN